MLLLCAPKATSQCQLKSLSVPARTEKRQFTSQSTKINKNPFVTRTFRPGLRVFLHTLFLEYATETGGNKCKAVLYTYKQMGMRSLELFWPCSILAKNQGDVLALSLSNVLGPCTAHPMSAFCAAFDNISATPWVCGLSKSSCPEYSSSSPEYNFFRPD